MGQKIFLSLRELNINQSMMYQKSRDANCSGWKFNLKKHYIRENEKLMI